VSEAIVVSGTDTGVGKTWVTARLLENMRRRGLEVAVRKPAQSFDRDDGLTDAEVLAAAAGTDPATVCPPHRWYDIPLAPPMAADALGRPPILLRDLIDEIQMPERATTLIEGAGGARSPLADDGDTVALASAIRAVAIVLVAQPGLGAINAVRLGAAAFAPIPVFVYLNRFETSNETHVRNVEWLTDKDGCEVHTSIPELADALVEDRSRHRKTSTPMEVG
jgi:dethiobiotin synthetase